MLEALHALSTPALRDLAASLRDGPLSIGITRRPLQQIAGTAAPALTKSLQTLTEAGHSPAQLALLTQAIADARVTNPTPDLDLILTGPAVPGVPTGDTAATFYQLVESARESVTLVGYAVHNGKKLFQRLAERTREDPPIEVTFYLNIPRSIGDTSLPSEIVQRFLHNFKEKHWPWEPLPQIYYYRRSLEENATDRASLHAKCVIVDDKAALITSANFTTAAQTKNVEAGVVVRDPRSIATLQAYLDGLTGATELLSASSP